MRFSVVGGDLRQALYARLLRSDGHEVLCAGLEGAGVDCVPLPEAVAAADYVVLPLPAGGGETLNAPFSAAPIGVTELVGLLAPGAVVLAGKVEGHLAELLSERGVRFADYFAREELTVKNAALTAEGAVELLLREMPGQLLGSRVLVTGFGRIGKLLALKLLALGARTSAAARKPGDLAFAEALGLGALDIRRLEGTLSGFDAVVNTVPACILTGDVLAGLSPGCLCLELASAPGGFDERAARDLGLRLVRAPGLPGKTAPEAAARAVRDTVYNIINELECGTWRG